MTLATSSGLVGGQFAPAHSQQIIAVVNPATEEQIGQIIDGDAQDVDTAVRCAHQTFVATGWADLPATDRAQYLDKLADALEARSQQIAAAVTEQNGMPISMSNYLNGPFVVDIYRYFARAAREMPFEETRFSDGVTGIIRRQPIGVAGLIVPWNSPHCLMAFKVGAALAAGCTTVIKPAPETSLDMSLFAEAVLEAGIPSGVVNIVTGGRETGAALVGHPLVTKIGFTGSTAAGKLIASRAGAQLKRVTLELGGKSAAILLDDADLSAFAQTVIPLCSPYSGQICVSNTRILAPRARYDEVVEVVVEAMRSGAVGDPMNPSTVFGPLVSERQRTRVEAYIEVGRKEGADVVVGGGRPKDLDRGYYFEPTVFRKVANSMQIAQEEIFGPVLAVIPYDTDNEAVTIANDSRYGLAGSIWTGDPERGLELARQIDVGQIRVNTMVSGNGFPFGGFKHSGLGRELGPEGVASYTELKTIYPMNQGDSAQSPLTTN
ncbi:aldehyde dehydrogenase [Nocardia vinacea]|uniref:Aldehyde dehydrogenase n=1 Tax=Nocardia vinacea TaxID=96468 RepID=A0ABZ1YUC6_9NOCA|nr:aldehyde dehydrogenase [Nocardia vinacea]